MDPWLAGASKLYVGDLFHLTKALIRAEFEAAALHRHPLDDPQVAEQLALLLAETSNAIDRAKWIQDRLRGIHRDLTVSDYAA